MGEIIFVAYVSYLNALFRLPFKVDIVREISFFIIRCNLELMYFWSNLDLANPLMICPNFSFLTSVF